MQSQARGTSASGVSRSSEAASTQAQPQQTPYIENESSDSQSRENLSPEEKKELAAEHMRTLLHAKKQLAAQTPAWQRIEHHDHPAPRGDDVAGAPQEGSTAPAGLVRPHGDRGGD